MKKLITILLLTIASTTFAQQNARGIKDNGVKGCGKCGVTSGRLAINYGLSKASSSSANMSTSKLSNFGLDYFHPIAVKEYFSWGFNVGGQYMFGASAPFSASLPSAFPITTQITTEVSGSGNTKTAGYFAGIGPQINLRIADRFVFSPIFQVGYLGVTQSEFKATQSTLIQGFALPNYTRKYDLISQTETKTNGLGFIPKARLTYMFTNKFGLWAEASYLLGPSQKSAVSTFKPQGVANNQGAYTVQQMDAGTYTTVNNESKYNALGFNFGLSYGFGGNNKPRSYTNETNLKCTPIIKPQVDTIYCVNGKIHFYGRVFVEANGTNVSELKLTSVKDKQGNTILTDVKLPMKMVFAEPDFPFNFEIDKSNCGKDLVINFETKSICTSKTQQFQAVTTKGNITIPSKRISCCDKSVGENDDNDDKCENNPISNGDFTEAGLIPGIMPKGKLPKWEKGYGSPKTIISQGCLDNGYVELSGNKLSGNAIYQKLDSKIISGKKYKVTVAVKYNKQQLDYGKIRVVAFNGLLSSGNSHPLPQNNIAIIGRSPQVHDCGDWSFIEFPVWKANKDFENIAINAYTNDDIISSTVLIDNISFCETLESDCKELETDVQGNQIAPTNLGIIPPTFSCTTYDDEDDYFNGNLTDLYSYNGTFDMYNQQFGESSDQCFNIGGELPQDVTNFNCDSELIAEGITETCDDIENLINSVNRIPQEIHNYPVLQPLTNTSLGECVSNNLKEKMAFGGRDIIYVHGLEFINIIDKANGVKGAMKNWPDKTEFYGNGYYKKIAEDNWLNHINNYKLGTYSNRYLIVTYNSSQDAETAANSIMSQIRDAMETGQDVVVDGADLRIKKDANGKPILDFEGNHIAQCFGKEYVIISHSTGGLVADIMLSIANKTKTAGSEQTKYGDVGYLSDRCKGHVAMHSAISGSNVAAVAVAAVPIAAATLKASSLIANTFTTLQNYSNFGFTDYSAVSLSDLSILVSNINTFINSTILVDLSPKVTYSRWSSIINDITVPVLTVSGNHPTGTPMTSVTKLVLKGLDDGVVNTESSSGRNQISSLIFSTFQSAKKTRAFDMGIPVSRASLFYIDQHKPFSDLFYCNSSPYLSVTGMVEPFSNIIINKQYNNHFTFLQAADQHMMPDNKMTCFIWGNYPNTNNYWQTYNNEEELVVNNKSLYNNGTINPLIINEMGEYLKYKDRFYPKLTIKKNKLGVPFPKIVWKRFYIWKRTYHRLKDAKTLDMYYAYKFLFPN